MKQLHIRMLTVMLLFTSACLQAQPTFYRIDSTRVLLGTGDTLLFPWAGGLNNPQFSAADLNNDGILDLMVFNRGSANYNFQNNGNSVMTFINHGTTNKIDYVYAPEYEANFPGMNQYALMQDMNCDGAPDILTTSDQSGMLLYYGHYDSHNMIYFTGPDSLKYSLQGVPGLQPIAFLPTGIPAIADVDGDGDLDILAYDYFANAFINLYQNMSEELSHTCGDSIQFKLTHYCWGRIAVSPVSNHVTFNIPDANCPGLPVLKTGTNAAPGGPRHNGGTICAFDQNGDKSTDLILGDISYNVLTSVLNWSRIDSALMQPPPDTTFPSYDTPVYMTIYPAAFYLDVDNDGKKDLLVSPNAPKVSENVKCAVLYKNTSPNDTVHFHLQSDSFLVNKMIDLGEGAYPVFVDIDGDGLKDLIVGNTGYFINNTYLKGDLAYYRNVGTIDKPAFQLITTDYDSLSKVQVNNLPIKSLAPAFYDMDGDGDLDMIVGNDNGDLEYFNNTAGAGHPANFVLVGQTYYGISVGNNSVPFIYDVNGDSLPDLLIGARNGKVLYFQNNGTRTMPHFSAIATNAFFGQIDIREGNPTNGFSNVGYASPIITPLDSTGKLYVLVGNEIGNIAQYEFNKDSVLSGSFNKVTARFNNLHNGEKTNLTVAQITSKKEYQMVVGNYRGGLSYYSQVGTTVGIDEITPAANDLKLTLFPNPASSQVTLVWQTTNPFAEAKIEVMDMLGRLVIEQKVDQLNVLRGNVTVSVSNLSKGLYNCRLIVNNQYVTSKLAIQ